MAEDAFYKYLSGKKPFGMLTTDFTDYTELF